jgi:hypothetical protein
VLHVAASKQQAHTDGKVIKLDKKIQYVKEILEAPDSESEDEYEDEDYY